MCYFVCCLYRTQRSRLKLTILWYSSLMELLMNGGGASRRYHYMIPLCLVEFSGCIFCCCIGHFFYANLVVFTFEIFSLEPMLFWQCHLLSVRLVLQWRKFLCTRYVRFFSSNSSYLWILCSHVLLLNCFIFSAHC